MTERFDAVVIGSGAGGGTAAKVLSPLCKDGRRVAVLEWGPKLREEEFTGRELEMAGRLYFDSGGFLTKDKSMTLAFAKAYGGSTVVYTGTSLVIPKETVTRWAVPGLEWEDLRRRSEKYAGENNVHLLGPEAINDNNRLFFDACRTLGWRAAQFPLNLKGCKGSGMCNMGCPNAAKQGTHRVQLPEAERNGVLVVTNCKVERIRPRGRGAELGVVVSSSGIGHPSLWPPGRRTIEADTVILSAGAVQSPALLLRSGFGAGLPALGRYFTAHPALILAAQHENPITNYHGHPKSYYCDHFAETDGFLLETCMYFPFTTAKSLSGFGAAHEAFVSRMDLLQMILVLALDEAERDNRVTIGPNGEPVVDYRLSPKTMRAFVSAMRASARLFFAAGARRVHAPASARFIIDKSAEMDLDTLINEGYMQTGRVAVSSAHLMGGCRMGESAADSVTDARGRVHGLPWLYVADASLFPRCSEVNPYLTVMALADRAAEAARERIASRERAAA
ncbi:MAG: GMC family oxidoreductase [Elusimicrobia bacterium]|nr:GMC family oxidoreductase [Elusimicrobiota bacterium]